MDPDVVVEDVVFPATIFGLEAINLPCIHVWLCTNLFFFFFPPFGLAGMSNFLFTHTIPGESESCSFSILCLPFYG